MDDKETGTDIKEPVIIKTRKVNFYKVGFFTLLLLLLLLAGSLGYSYSRGRVVFSTPLSINDPAVLRTSLVYAFKTKIVSIEEKDGKTILKTDLTGSNIPEFVITNNTKIVLVQNETDYRANKSILKPGNPVYLYLAYNLKTKQWLTTRIALVSPIAIKVTPPAVPKASASASGKLKPVKK